MFPCGVSSSRAADDSVIIHVHICVSEINFKAFQEDSEKLFCTQPVGKVFLYSQLWKS